MYRTYVRNLNRTCSANRENVSKRRSNTKFRTTRTSRRVNGKTDFSSTGHGSSTSVRVQTTEKSRKQALKVMKCIFKSTYFHENGTFCTLFYHRGWYLVIRKDFYWTRLWTFSSIPLRFLPRSLIGRNQHYPTRGTSTRGVFIASLKLTPIFAERSKVQFFFLFFFFFGVVYSLFRFRHRKIDCWDVQRIAVHVKTFGGPLTLLTNKEYAWCAKIALWTYVYMSLIGITW